MKDANIRLVTVSLDLPDADNQETEAHLRNCASDDPENPGQKFYFDTDTNEELSGAFGAIRDSLARSMFLSK